MAEMEVSRCLEHSGSAARRIISSYPQFSSAACVTPLEAIAPNTRSGYRILQVYKFIVSVIKT